MRGLIVMELWVSDYECFFFGNEISVCVCVYVASTIREF